VADAAQVEEFLEHFGVKGMHWGVHRGGGGSSSPVSEDHATAQKHVATVKAHGTKALSNDELKQLVDRLNLEQQHGRLNPEPVSAGKKIVSGLLGAGSGVAGNVAKQQATSLANKYAAKGIEELLKKSSGS
jgi:hypothetical protein